MKLEQQELVLHPVYKLIAAAVSETLSQTIDILREKGVPTEAIIGGIAIELGAGLAQHYDKEVISAANVTDEIIRLASRVMIDATPKPSPENN